MEKNPVEEYYFEWDENKNLSNVKKHGIAFESALKVFSDQVIWLRSDRKDEERYKVIGLSENRIIAVIMYETTSCDQNHLSKESAQRRSARI